jgi:hypothetical protein
MGGIDVLFTAVSNIFIHQINTPFMSVKKLLLAVRKTYGSRKKKEEVENRKCSQAYYEKKEKRSVCSQ